MSSVFKDYLNSDESPIPDKPFYSEEFPMPQDFTNLEENIDINAIEELKNLEYNGEIPLGSTNAVFQWHNIIDIILDIQQNIPPIRTRISPQYYELIEIIGEIKALDLPLESEPIFGGENDNFLNSISDLVCQLNLISLEDLYDGLTLFDKIRTQISKNNSQSNGT